MIKNELNTHLIEIFVFQVLIATSTLAWGVNFPAHLVVVKGTEFYDGKTKRYVDFPITGSYLWELSIVQFFPLFHVKARMAKNISFGSNLVVTQHSVNPNNFVDNLVLQFEYFANIQRLF